MHRNYGDADINRVDIEFRDKLRDGTATARVDFSEFRGLPDDFVVVKDFSHSSAKFRARVVRSAFSARTREFTNRRSVRNKTCVLLFVNPREIRIVAGGYVRRKANAVCANESRRFILRRCDDVDNILVNPALHTGVTLASDFLFVGKNDEYGVFVVFFVQKSRKSGIRANSVVMPVCADKGSVKAYIAGVK